MYMSDFYFELPDLQLPFSPDELFDENDIRIIESRYNEVNIDPNSRFINTTNCVWGSSDMVAAEISAERELASSNHVANVGYIAAKKYQTLLWEYIHDTFHPDFIRPLLVIGSGKKIVHANLLCTKETFGDSVQDWHNETPRTMFPDIINVFRNEVYVNFRLYGETEVDTTKVQFATISEELQKHIHTTYTNMFENIPHDVKAIPPELFNRIEDAIMLRASDDHMAQNTKWDEHFTVADEYNGFVNPYCINTSCWHRLFNTKKPRCTLRLSGNPEYKFEYFRNLQLEGKFIK